MIRKLVIQKLAQLNVNARNMAVTAIALLFCILGCSREHPEFAGVEGQSVEKQLGAFKTPIANRHPLDPGTFTVAFSEELLTIQSNRAARLAILQRVASVAEFDLVVGDIEPQMLTMQIEKILLPQALPMLLTDLPYVVKYVFDSTRKVHVLASLQVGATEAPDVTIAALDDETEFKLQAVADAATASEAQTQINPPPRGDEIQQEPPVIDHQVAEGLQLEAESLQREIEELIFEQAELFDHMQSSAGQIRAEAIPELPIAGEGLDVIIGALALDPDPEIRAAAAQRLSKATGFATINGLIDAIDDPDPEVSMQAIRSLVNIGDRSVILNMQQASEHHSDPLVQQALEEGMRSLVFSVRMDSDGIEEVPGLR